MAALNYNTNVHESTKHTPYEVLFGQLARLPSSDPLKTVDLLPTYQGYVERLVNKLNMIQKLVYDNLIQTKIATKERYDKKLNTQTFKVGDLVFLTSGPKPGKLENQQAGPYKILETLSNNNIRIKIGNSDKIVHGNRLILAKL